MILDSILTLVNIAEKSTGLYDWFTGVSQGEQLKKTISELEATKAEVRKLSDHILWAPNIQEATSRESSAKISNDAASKIVQTFSEHSKALGSDILVTSLSSTPERLRAAFKTDPFEVLFDARPLHRAKRPNDPDMIPIMFSDGNQQFIGWQKQGALPSLFNCDFHAAITSKEFPFRDQMNAFPDSINGELFRRVLYGKKIIFGDSAVGAKKYLIVQCQPEKIKMSWHKSNIESPPNFEITVHPVDFPFEVNFSADYGVSFMMRRFTIEKGISIFKRHQIELEFYTPHMCSNWGAEEEDARKAFVSFLASNNFSNLVDLDKL